MDEDGEDARGFDLKDLVRQHKVGATNYTSANMRFKMHLLLETRSHTDTQRTRPTPHTQASKGSSRKGKKRGRRGNHEDTFEVNAADPRFQAIFTDRQYAIDPNHPSFKDTVCVYVCVVVFV